MHVQVESAKLLQAELRVGNATKGKRVTRQRCGRKERRMTGRRYTCREWRERRGGKWRERERESDRERERERKHQEEESADINTQP